MEQSISEIWTATGLKGLEQHQITEAHSSFELTLNRYRKLGVQICGTPPLQGYAIWPGSGATAVNDLRTCLDSCKYFDLDIHPDVDAEKFHLPKSDLIERQTHLLSLNLTSDELFKAMSTNRRRNIKKAEKMLEISWDDHRDEVFALFEETAKERDFLFSASYVEHLLSPAFDGFRHWSVVKQDGVVVASNLFTLKHGWAYYLLGGVRRDIGVTGAGPYSLWKCILHAKELGSSTFDFCGSAIPSIAEYFKSFGAYPKAYYQLKTSNKVLSTMKAIKDRIT